jgi:hypothetical protein
MRAHLVLGVLHVDLDEVLQLGARVDVAHLTSKYLRGTAPVHILVGCDAMRCDANEDLNSLRCSPKILIHQGVALEILGCKFKSHMHTTSDVVPSGPSRIVNIRHANNTLYMISGKNDRKTLATGTERLLI